MRAEVRDGLPAELTARTAVLLREVLARVEATGEEALATLDLSGREYGVLALLVHDDAARNQRHLGAALGIDRTTTMKLMAGLESRGLVERGPDPADRRSYRLVATDAGRALCARADLVLSACDDVITEGRLDEHEVVVLRDLLRRLV
ncbi:MarR family winged helix-turn-helix transcriptional regulator [Nocardioides renjunii]|uniref:MarR family winged helix-turn-helix transcriptional regulator n=1 Tax=Nocardioides renjunii TaxID=3095075 RepID=UPI002AFF3247|nr:MarR family transcriptional regulator [Nocardioides sp. S-34]WQQ22935.1 MarR family transcriptional regulator [Nocardioides sp. S-34]